MFNMSDDLAYKSTLYSTNVRVKTQYEMSI